MNTSLSTNPWNWLNRTARGIVRDAAYGALGFGLLMCLVIAAMGDQSARMLTSAAHLGDSPEDMRVAWLAVVGGHALLVMNMALSVAVLSAALRLSWPPVRWTAQTTWEVMVGRFPGILSVPERLRTGASRAGYALQLLGAGILLYAAVLAGPVIGKTLWHVLLTPREWPSFAVIALILGWGVTQKVRNSRRASTAAATH